MSISGRQDDFRREDKRITLIGNRIEWTVCPRFHPIFHRFPLCLFVRSDWNPAGRKLDTMDEEFLGRFPLSIRVQIGVPVRPSPGFGIEIGPLEKQASSGQLDIFRWHLQAKLKGMESSAERGRQIDFEMPRETREQEVVEQDEERDSGTRDGNQESTWYRTTTTRHFTIIQITFEYVWIDSNHD